jgi:hypothetical protein
MRMSKVLVVAAATVGVMMIAPAPSNAQPAYQTRTTAPPVAQRPKPATSGPTVRDHRKSATTSGNAAGGVTVTESDRKRQKASSSSCVKSTLGGPCVGGYGGRFIANTVTLAGAVSGKKLIRDEVKPKRKQTVDHRKQQ